MNTGLPEGAIFSVPPRFKFLARREDFTVARPASSARHQVVPSDSLAPNSPAQFGRTHEPLHPVLHAGRLPCDCGALPSAPSRSAFLPLSAVFHSAPPRSERFLKTPQRSEGTQSGKGRQRVPRTHCGGWQSLPPPLPPHALRFRCASAALCSSRFCGSPALAGLHDAGCKRVFSPRPPPREGTRPARSGRKVRRRQARCPHRASFEKRPAGISQPTARAADETTRLPAAAVRPGRRPRDHSHPARATAPRAPSPRPCAGWPRG